MTRKTLEELAAAYGLGALDQAEATQLEALMAQDADARQEVAAFIDAAAAFAHASTRPPSNAPGFLPVSRLRHSCIARGRRRRCLRATVF
jgi:anti-sigma-K factor RskA